MSIFGDEPTKKLETAVPGEDLYGLSVSELSERIELYEAEITRLKLERTKKAAEQDAAHALFGKQS